MRATRGVPQNSGGSSIQTATAVRNTQFSLSKNWPMPSQQEKQQLPVHSHVEQPQLLASGRYVTAPVQIPAPPPPTNYQKSQDRNIGESLEVAELKQQLERLMMKNAQLLTEMERLEKARLDKEEQDAVKVKALQSRVAELESIIAERDMRPSGNFGENVLFRSEVAGDDEMPVISWNDVEEIDDNNDENAIEGDTLFDLNSHLGANRSTPLQQASSRISINLSVPSAYADSDQRGSRENAQSNTMRFQAATESSTKRDIERRQEDQFGRVLKKENVMTTDLQSYLRKPLKMGTSAARTRKPFVPSAANPAGSKQKSTVMNRANGQEQNDRIPRGAHGREVPPKYREVTLDFSAHS